MELLTVAGLGLAEQDITVLHPISFVQRRGQKLALAGESGAGKSTLLQIIAGLVQPSAGEVRVAGTRVRGPAETLVAGHAGVAYLSQRSELPQHLRVEQVLRYASKRPATEAQAVYELCRIDHLGARRTDQLSGGEQQRVALAMALAQEPRALLLDEPTVHLDVAHQVSLLALVRRLCAEQGLAVLAAMHDINLTALFFDRLLMLAGGAVVSQGTPQETITAPLIERAFGTAVVVTAHPTRGVPQVSLLP